MVKKVSIILFSVLFLTMVLSAQVTNSYENTCSFIKELSTMGVWECNPAIQSYSNFEIYQLINQKIDIVKLTSRQQMELDLYKKFYQRYAMNDTLAKPLRVKLDGNGRYNLNSGNGNSVSEISFGATLHFLYKSNWHATVGFTKFYETDLLTDTSFFVDRLSREMEQNGSSWSGDELAYNVGYISDKLSLTLTNDRISWGTGYHGTNIFSGNSPRFGKIKLRFKPFKWFEFNYFHGRLDPLMSRYINDSINSQSSVDMHKKYIAANLFTFKPSRSWHLSIGNSIVYSQNSIKPVFLIPFMFYKSVDHTYNGVRNDTGQNAQMFATTSLRVTKWWSLYSSLFIDEINMSNIRSKEKNSNLLSYKLGVRLQDLIPNVSFIVEYTHNRPMVYEHFIYSTNFTTEGYNMGHALGENASELFWHIDWHPAKGVNIYVENYNRKKGPALINAENNNGGLPFLETIVFEESVTNIGSSWFIKPNLGITFNYKYTNPKGDLHFIPELYRKKGGVVSLGIVYGL